MPSLRRGDSKSLVSLLPSSIRLTFSHLSLSVPLPPCIHTPMLSLSLSTVERDLCYSKLVQNFMTWNISLKSLFESPSRLSVRCNRISPIEEQVSIVFNWNFATHCLCDYFCPFCTIFPWLFDRDCSIIWPNLISISRALRFYAANYALLINFGYIYKIQSNCIFKSCLI